MELEEKMLRNFVNKYGIDGLRRITELFVQQVSNEKIASEFKVTRQRVHQWQKAFTTSEVYPKNFVSQTLKSNNLVKSSEKR